jgi:hypothetical protein
MEHEGELKVGIPDRGKIDEKNPLGIALEFSL